MNIEEQGRKKNNYKNWAKKKIVVKHVQT